MVWGLVIEPGKKYTLRLKNSLLISNAALELSQAITDEYTTLMLDLERKSLGLENKRYLLCWLNKTNKQERLKWNFLSGDRITIYTHGDATVNLSGNYGNASSFVDMLEEEEEKDNVEDDYEMENNLKGNKRSLPGNGLANSKKKMKLDTDLEESEEESEEGEKLRPSAKSVQQAKPKKRENKPKCNNACFHCCKLQPQQQQAKPSEQPQQQQAKPTKQPQQQQAKPAKQQQQANPAKQQQQAKPAKQQQAKPVKQPQQQQAKPAKQPQQQQAKPGVDKKDLKTGSGDKAVDGKKVFVYFKGWLQRDSNVIIDEHQRHHGQPLPFRMGRGHVIKGWEQGIRGMKVGGKRRLTIPAHLAYGKNGSPLSSPVVPPDSTLVYEVELLNVQ